MFKKINFINYLISAIPLTLILGNLAVNINIILICITGLIIFGKKIFIDKNNRYFFLIYIFFFYLILITLLSNIPNLGYRDIYKENIFKSFFFLRFLLLFLIISKLIEENKFNTKLFFISCAFFSFALAIDILIQVIFGKDLVGYEISKNRPSGFFGGENVAGNYLQKFILFFIILFILKILKNSHKKLPVLIIFFIFLIPIVLTENRMSMIIYISSILLFFIIQNKIKEVIVLFIVFLFFFQTLIKYPLSVRMEAQFTALKYDVKSIFIKAPKLFFSDQYEKNNEQIPFGSTGYLIHFNSGVQVWKKNKIFGDGLRSFRLNCKYGNNQTCNTHPHNYVLEIMIDTGIVGLLLIYTFVLIFFVKYLKFYFSDRNQINKLISTPFFLITFFEFFPIRSSGSFFSTSNSVIIFLILAIFVNIEKIKKF